MHPVSGITLSIYSQWYTTPNWHNLRLSRLKLFLTSLNLLLCKSFLYLPKVNTYIWEVTHIRVDKYRELRDESAALKNFDLAAKNEPKTNSKSFIWSSWVQSIIIILVKDSTTLLWKHWILWSFLSQEMNIWSWSMLIKILLFCYFYSNRLCGLSPG